VQYLRAYRFPFDNPNWLANLGFVTLCVLSTAVIPIVGVMVCFGYLFEVVEALHRQGNDRTYPDFRWDKFVDYLVRGALVFVVQLIAGLLFSIVIVAAIAVVVAIVIVAMPGELNIYVIVAAVAVVLLLLFVISIFLNIVMVPLILRIGLTQDFGNTFSWSFVKDYASRMRWPTVKVALFLLFGGLVLDVIGFALCIVGIYPAAALAMFGQFHCYYQLYEMYLERGGTPIPLKSVTPAPEHVGPG
jgi:hypothetical protein